LDAKIVKVFHAKLDNKRILQIKIVLNVTPSILDYLFDNLYY